METTVKGTLEDCHEYSVVIDVLCTMPGSYIVRAQKMLVVVNVIIRLTSYLNISGSSFPHQDYISASETFSVKYPNSI